MPLTLLQNANFGRNRAGVTGSLGVGYAVLDVAGSVVAPRTTVGVYEITSGSGVYAANVTYPDGFNGQILWDCPSITGSFGMIMSQSFATEAQNFQANDPKVADTWQMVNTITGSIQSLYNMNFGRWKIDPVTNQMYFYDPSGLTLIATFNLTDSTFTPTTDAVFQRQNAAFASPGP
jgi:hypothetical protein